MSQISSLLEKNFNQFCNKKFIMILNLVIPSIIILILFFARKLAEILVIQSLPILKTDIPVLYNIPLYAKLKYSNLSAKTRNCEEWYLYDFEKEVNDTKTRNIFKDIISNKHMGYYYCDDNPPQFNLSPYFRTPIEAQKNQNETNINEYLYERSYELNHIDINTLEDESSLSSIPDGAIKIKKLNETYFNYQIQIRDYMVSNYHRGNGITLFYIFNENTKGYELFPSAVTGSMWEMGIFNKAYTNYLFPNVTIISGIQILPIGPEDNEVNVQRIAGIVTFGIYPLSISLLIPLFIHNIVYEREKKIIELLKINGVKMKNYWISNFIFNYIVYLLMVIPFYMSEALLSNLNILKNTNFSLILVTLLGWGIGQIGISYFFQAFISNENTAIIISFIIVFLIYFFSLCLNLALYVLPREAPYILNIFPIFALYRIFHYITFSCGFQSCLRDFKDVNTELIYALILLYIGGFLFVLLGIYLNDIFQKRNIKKNLFYFNHKDKIINKINNKNKLISNDKKINNFGSNILKANLIDENDQDLNELNNPKSLIQLSDKENKNVKSLINLEKNELKQYPFICDKISDENNIYLDKFSLCINKSEIVGILESNGESKQYFYSIINHIFKQNNENIYFYGNDIKNNMDKFHKFVGFCPENNILWNDLTVEETLLFFSKIKNNKDGKDKIRKNVKKILSLIRLESKKEELVENLKEGMKRRLSLGIAMIAKPYILFLDEPVKGQTIRDKRRIWKILNKFKEKSSIILVSNLIDEIKICNRVCIFSEGNLKYIGNQYKFINQYSKKLKLEISLKQCFMNKDTMIKNIRNKNENELMIQENMIKIIDFMTKNCPKGCIVFEKYHYNIIFLVENDNNFQLLFNLLERSKEKLQIANWSISQFNLEDLYINL